MNNSTTIKFLEKVAQEFSFQISLEVGSLMLEHERAENEQHKYGLARKYIQDTVTFAVSRIAEKFDADTAQTCYTIFQTWEFYGDWILDQSIHKTIIKDSGRFTRIPLPIIISTEGSIGTIFNTFRSTAKVKQAIKSTINVYPTNKILVEEMAYAIGQYYSLDYITSEEVFEFVEQFRDLGILTQENYAMMGGIR